jgi:prepilin-type N-terminal cleavage/methylation domain-containing protein
MSANRCRSAFTLLEILIVVVIMAVLAATIIPQFTASTNDAKVSTAAFNLSTMRSQIQLYSMQHNSVLPTGANNLQQFTLCTDVTGTITSPTTTATCPYGPYCQTIPVNPFTGSNTVTLFTGTGTPTASGSATAGWIYSPTTGSIWIDNATYLSQL